MKKDGENMNVVGKAAEMLEKDKDNVTVIEGGDAPTGGNTAISTTTTDQVADPDKVVNINVDKLHNVDNQKIIDACEAMQLIDEKREGLNTDARAERDKLKQLGIPTAAFNAAYARFKMGEKKRAELDAAYAKCANAMGVGFQAGLF